MRLLKFKNFRAFRLFRGNFFLLQLMLGGVLLLSANQMLGLAIRNPQIGYLYPAGGQQGKVVLIAAGGQFLARPKAVFISGSGVSGKIIKYIRPTYNLNREQRDDLIEKLGKVRDKNMEMMSAKERKVVLDKMKMLKKRKRRKPRTKAKVERAEAAKPTTQKPGDKNKPVIGKVDPKRKFGGRRMADHPLLMDLENKSLRELLHITNIIFADRRKKQQNRQLGEMVVIEITIDKDAPPGKRELRMLARAGLTNPIIFEVGTLPEISELEPNSASQAARLPKPLKMAVLEAPILINGQIMPGDIDEFNFRAKQGDALVFEVSARSLIPYLADAVPGWFQATLTLYDERGKEVAFDDDFRFSPDPVLFFKIPRNGVYRLKIRDSIYRGREDFVYRIAVAKRPFITQLFPLGGRTGIKTAVTVSGWNLPEQQLTLDTAFSDREFREVVYVGSNGVSNFIPYAVGMLSETDESEPNDSMPVAQAVKLPLTVNGRISRPGEADVFKFTGKAGTQVVAEIYARQLNSPLDSLLQLLDSSGKIIAWNDDFVHKEKYLHKARVGIMTHYADSYLMAKIPADGSYYIRLTDVQNHGGNAYAYRLRLSPPQPDFVLFTTPSSISMRTGIPYAIKVHLLRRDGFDGAVKISLPVGNKDFELSGGIIPVGHSSIQMTLMALNKGSKEPFKLQLTGTAETDGVTFKRQAIPADNVMQAFLYRHLLPAKQLAVYVRPQKWNANPVRLLSKAPVKISVGGKAEVKIQFRWGKYLNSLEFSLSQPPKGLTIGKVRILPKNQGIAFDLHADAKKLKAGFNDNIMVEVVRKYTNKKTKKVSRSHAGFLPAIPIKIVAK
ncbi:MAG: hypothetical protein L3J71_10170 [Victivallaceae bacterium]|nr:hypothetical protein [Victivallaceae bacterium]